MLICRIATSAAVSGPPRISRTFSSNVDILVYPVLRPDSRNPCRDDHSRIFSATFAACRPWMRAAPPRTADAVEWEDWRFEVVDLDGKRVDKVLVTPVARRS